MKTVEIFGLIIAVRLRNRTHKSISIANKRHQWIIKFKPFCIHKYSAA